jgi:hypothetical protein
MKISKVSILLFLTVAFSTPTQAQSELGPHKSIRNNVSEVIIENEMVSGSDVAIFYISNDQEEIDVFITSHGPFFGKGELAANYLDNLEQVVISPKGKDYTVIKYTEK